MKHMRTHHSLSVCFERMIIFIARGGKGGGGGGEKFVGDHAVFQGERRVISCRQQSLKWVGAGGGGTITGGNNQSLGSCVLSLLVVI